MDKIYDICIVGGGASGMAAAIKANRTNSDLSIVVIEKNIVLGKKLKATGNGRCNITNVNAVNYLENMKFFNYLSLLPKEEEGRIYPNSFDSGDVVSILVEKIYGLNIEIINGNAAREIHRDKDAFRIKLDDGELITRRVLLACGGKAAPIFGTTGDGYGMARKLGHRVTRLAPVLVPIECEGDFTGIKGIRARGILTLVKNKEIIFSETGEIQFTEYGISGICTFNATRFMKFDENKSLDNYRMYFDFAPNVDIYEFINNKVGQSINENSREKNANILRSIVKAPMAKSIIDMAGVRGDDFLRSLKETDVRRIEGLVHEYPIIPKKIKGWKSAQCTAGGVDINDINMDTMESKVCPGLYLSGELIDYDGPCGGYNLDNAWFTGAKAGESMAKQL